MDIKKLVIKPLCSCNANCYACESRKDLYKKIYKNSGVPVDKLIPILDQAQLLGTQNIAISGGEPLLYKDLFLLIRECKKRNFLVALNSNGSLIDEEIANNLICSGLDSIYISLDSCNPRIHDYLRRAEIWDKAVTGLDLLIKAKKKQSSSLIIGIRSILSRYLLRDLDEMILFGLKLGIDAHQLSYVEYDKKALLVPTNEDILFFENNTKIKIKTILKDLNLSNLDDLISSIDCLFEEVKGREYSKSVYGSREIGLRKCLRPFYFALILQNGDVAPCNLIEYTHKPIAGNVFEQSLKEIWESSPSLLRFRQKRFNDCKYCPMLIHQKLNYYEGRESR